MICYCLSIEVPIKVESSVAEELVLPVEAVDLRVAGEQK